MPDGNVLLHGLAVTGGLEPVSPMAKQAIRKVAARVHRDPQKATLDDIRKLARAWLLEVDGRLPE